MNKKGFEGSSVGMLIVVAVAIIVGLVLLQQSATNVGTLTTMDTVTNSQITAPAVGSSITLQGQAVSGFSATNGTSGDAIPASNYTITSRVVSNGQLVSTLTALDGTTIGWQGKLINVTYTYEPYGYDTSSGGRAIANLIIVFFAIGIAVIALAVILKEKMDFGF